MIMVSWTELDKWICHQLGEKEKRKDTPVKHAHNYSAQRPRIVACVGYSYSVQITPSH